MSHLYQPLPINTRKADKILQIVSTAFAMPVEQIKSSKRDDRTIQARFICYWLLYRYAGDNYFDIGKYMGKTHAAVMRGIDKITFALKTETWVSA
jgi:chromosomal replication initiation ATPase DnaA